MTTQSKTADQAGSLFSKTQTQSMSLNRILSERDAVSEAREAKTARLREQRGAVAVQLAVEVRAQGADLVFQLAGPVGHEAMRPGRRNRSFM